jgi:hypothetical protein
MRHLAQARNPIHVVVMVSGLVRSLSSGRAWRGPVGTPRNDGREKILLLVQPDLGRPVPFAKIFRFSFDPNQLHIPRHPGPHKGAFRDRHERRVGMRWTQVARLTRALCCGRRSRVVLTPRRWRQVGERNFTGDGGKKARSPRRARNKLLKPSRAGMPGDPGATVVTNACAYYLRARGCGCNGHPAFPAPLLG